MAIHILHILARRLELVIYRLIMINLILPFALGFIMIIILPNYQPWTNP